MSAKIKQHKINVKVELNEALNKIANDTSDNIKRNAKAKNIGGQKYINGWTYKKDGKGYVVYNDSQPSLTHLLENGHIIKNHYGTGGKGKKKKTSPRPHIRPAYKQTISDLSKYKSLIKVEKK